MILADHGANVVRVDRAAGGKPRPTLDNLSRGKRSIALDLQSPGGQDALRRLVRKSDVLIEPFRPGVMERLGLGPEVLCADNPALVYARMTGFGQGQLPPIPPLYAFVLCPSLSCPMVLSALRLHGQRPNPPLGVLLALFERTRSGRGQVVDAAMVDGAAYIASFLWKGVNAGAMVLMPPPTLSTALVPMQDNSLDGVGRGLLDGGAPFYGTYRCQDGSYFSVGAIEPQFYKQLLKGLGLDGDPSLPSQMDRSQWVSVRQRFEQVFLSKTRDEWATIFRGTDACAFPVLDFAEATSHPHNLARGTFVPFPMTAAAGGLPEPGPAPRLSRTAGQHTFGTSLPIAGQHTSDVLVEWGFAPEE
eukprot:gene10623-1931_t